MPDAQLVILPPTEPETGGDERNRTANLLVANQALSRLSYVPVRFTPDKANGGPTWTRTTDLILIRDAL